MSDGPTRHEFDGFVKRSEQFQRDINEKVDNIVAHVEQKRVRLQWRDVLWLIITIATATVAIIFGTLKLAKVI